MAPLVASDARPTVDVLIFAGGIGSRMGAGTRPKQFLELSGRPIIDYTIAHFAHHPLVSSITISCVASWAEYLESFLETRHYATPIEIVPGGSTGQESIFNALDCVHRKREGEPDGIVLVHDGVRPLIDADAITACIESVAERGCTATIAPAIETVIVRDEEGMVSDVLDRSHCSLARAPQGFWREDFHAAHLRAICEGRNDFIDSVSLMSHYGHAIFTVEGPVENIKVTTPTDYYAFKAYMEARDQSALWRD